MRSPADPLAELGFDDDQELNDMLSALAKRESVQLFERVFSELDRFALTMLRNASAEEHRVYAQAFAHVAQCLRSRIKRLRSENEKQGHRPIVVTNNRGGS